MRKYLLIIFLMKLALSADPVNNPFNPAIIQEGFFISPNSWINLRVGYEGSAVYDGRFERVNSSGAIDNFKQEYNSGTVTVNIHERCDLFGIIGASRIRSDWRYLEGDTNNRIQIESNNRLCWGAGGKVILFQWTDTVLSSGGRFYQTKPSLAWALRNGTALTIFEEKIYYHDWQVDVGISHKIDMFIPYIGAKYLRANSKLSVNGDQNIDTNSNSLKMKNKENFGMYLGCSLSNGKLFMLDLEVRLFDEDALSLTGEIRF